jgi:hypothetical protein
VTEATPSHTAFIAKPFIAKQLLDAVRAVLPAAATVG